MRTRNEQSAIIRWRSMCDEIAETQMKREREKKATTDDVFVFTLFFDINKANDFAGFGLASKPFRRANQTEYCLFTLNRPFLMKSLTHSYFIWSCRFVLS